MLSEYVLRALGEMLDCEVSKLPDDLLKEVYEIDQLTGKAGYGGELVSRQVLAVIVWNWQLRMKGKDNE